MREALNRVAAANNAEWCAAMWRSHGLSVEQAHGMWFCRHPTPQYYPNVITVDAGVEPAKQVTFIAELARLDNVGFSVKDSFSYLDLSGVGFQQLFDAHWLYRRKPVSPALASTLDWQRISDEPALAAWERAWRGNYPNPSRLFRAELLADQRVCILAGFDKRKVIRAGGLAYSAGGATGVTNIFGSRLQFENALFTLLGPADIVCYERGSDLELAADLGFSEVGGLRVWVQAQYRTRELQSTPNSH